MRLKKRLLFTTVFILLLSLCTAITYADENKIGTVTATKLNLRKSANTTSTVLDSLYKGQRITILETAENWYKIQTDNKLSGWVSSTYVTTNSTSTASTGTSRGASSRAAQLATDIIDYAKTLRNVKYVYGGTTPKGFDCSGFVKYVFDHVGINLERVSSSQATQGKAVKKAELLPGDVVFFDTNGGLNKINHVGIYVGDGNFIHASSASSAKKVVISSLETGNYAKKYMTARRLF